MGHDTTDSEDDFDLENFKNLEVMSSKMKGVETLSDQANTTGIGSIAMSPRKRKAEDAMREAMMTDEKFDVSNTAENKVKQSFR